jgi:hypothetical protein
MRSVVSRLARLERFNLLSTAPRRLRIEYGYLRTPTDDYIAGTLSRCSSYRQVRARIPATIGSSGKIGLGRDHLRLPTRSTMSR